MGRCFVAVAFLVASCTKPTPPSPPAASSSAVATWDGGVVTEAEVRSAVRQLGPGLKEQFDSPGGRAQFVDALVAKRLLAAEARKRGIHQQPEIRRQIEELEERLVIQALLAEDARTQPPTDETTLRRYYSENSESFRQPPAVHVLRVLLRKAGKEATARASLERLRQRILKGEDASRVAAQGDGAERATGGDIGWLSEGTGPLTRAALALQKVGEASPLVELDDAFAFVVLVERREARLPPFEEVRETVASRYTPIAQRQVFDRLVKRLFSESGVRLDTAVLE